MATVQVAEDLAGWFKQKNVSFPASMSDKDIKLIFQRVYLAMWSVTDGLKKSLTRDLEFAKQPVKAALQDIWPILTGSRSAGTVESTQEKAQEALLGKLSEAAAAIPARCEPPGNVNVWHVNGLIQLDLCNKRLHVCSLKASPCWQPVTHMLNAFFELLSRNGVRKERQWERDAKRVPAAKKSIRGVILKASTRHSTIPPPFRKLNELLEDASDSGTDAIVPITFGTLLTDKEMQELTADQSRKRFDYLIGLFKNGQVCPRFTCVEMPWHALTPKPTFLVQAYLQFPVGYTMQPMTGSTRWTHFAWRLPLENDAHAQEFKNSELTEVLLREYIPKVLSAEKEAELMEAYSNPAVNLSKGLVTYLLDKVGVHRGNKHRNAAREATSLGYLEQIITLTDTAFIKNALAAGLDPTDMRFMNGRSDDATFSDFIECVHTRLSSRDQLAAEERRNVGDTAGARDGEASAVRPTPLAPSVSKLYDLIIQDMHNSAQMQTRLENGSASIPSLSAFRSFMSPSHPDRLVSDRYSGRAGIIFKIQCRSARKVHDDAHYNNMQAVLLRCWMAHLSQAGVPVLFISDDDKCKIAVGAPGFAQTAISRQSRTVVGVLSATFA